MQLKAVYPTPAHQQAAETLVEFFKQRSGVEAVLLVNSCARGKASPDSCLDIIILIDPQLSPAARTELEAAWADLYHTQPLFQALRQAGRYSVVHPDFVDGIFLAEVWDDGGGPDEFELRLGNFLAYSVTLWSGSDYLADLKAKWLPYYGETLRRQRLAMIRQACLEDLDHIPLYVARGLHFQTFDRLYKAFQEFLQALFIAHGQYPLAYNKWIREQFEEILQRPDLYRQLPGLLEVVPFESEAVIGRADQLKRLVDRHLNYG